jgi:glucose/arabinose dehydrogenase
MSARHALAICFSSLAVGLLLSACSDGATRPPQNAAPVATIRVPAQGTTFAAGQVITFAGSGSDAQDGAIPESRMTWWADLHHDTHAHPFMTATTGADSGTVVIPVRGETSDNIWYRFYLAVTDSEGAADTVFRDIQPRKATLQFTSVPAGLQLTVDGQPRTTPFQITGVVGMERDLGVVSPQTLGGTGYTFTSWSQGGAASQVLVWPSAAATYTATFTQVQGPVNLPPTVSVSSPQGGAQITVGTATTVSATAADADGSVAQVEFFAGAQSLGTDASSPFSVQWTPSATGTVSLTARATDNEGAQTTSAPVSVTINPAGGGDQTPPTVNLTAPASGASNLTGTITLTATAADNVGVAGVQFQIDGANAGAEDTSAPYQASVTVASHARGVHVVRARSRDAAGNFSAWDTATISFGGTQSLAAGFTSAQFGSNLPDLGTALAFAPDGRLFVALKGGAIRVIANGTLLPASFANFPVDGGGERGLIGIAFHPQFATNGYVYVHYSTTTGAARISRLTANGNVMVAGSELPLVTFPVESSPFHNGGAIHFGPDGKLYVALGDDGVPASAQSMTSVFGKILRFNDDGSIPTDNPFASTTTGLNRAIWAIGLRNPFTFAFQPGTGRMFINDVGQNSWEEVNEGAAGRNFGWPATEGYTTNPSYTSPVFAYPHFGSLVTGLSIVGAAFYNPAVQQFPASYVGSYFFADYVDGWVHRLDPGNANAVSAFAWLPDNITDLAVGPDGALYVLLATSFSSAQVHRISYTP